MTDVRYYGVETDDRPSIVNLNFASIMVLCKRSDHGGCLGEA
jgi:hypothetical protein